MSVLDSQQKRWLAARKKLLLQIKAQVRQFLGPEPEDLREYALSYKAEFFSKWSPASHRDLFKSVDAAQIVLGGDFHAFSQSQRTHLRILRSLPDTRNVCLALECVESVHQKHLDAFMAREVSEEEFLKLVDWDLKWGFTWENYRPLFDLARSKGYRVFGVNKYASRRSGKSLFKRDEHAASVIGEISARHPECLIYVLYGDLHLAKRHLPEKLRKKLSGGGACVTIFQNSERLYFQLARKGLEHEVEVMASSNLRFCILGSPPWVKWQSYLMFLEHTFDQDIDDEEDDDESVDFTDYISNLIKLVAEDLSVKMVPSDVAVYSAADDRIFEGLVEDVPPGLQTIAEYSIRNDRSFYLPKSGLFYLSRHTINHAASLAGQYVHAKLCKRQRLFWQVPQDFLGLIWIEAVGFFVSKLINHKRKAETVRDLKNQLAVTSPDDHGREALLLALDQRMREVIAVHTDRFRPLKVKPRRKASYIEAARLLGHMLGEKLYLSYRNGRISGDKLLEVLSQDMSHPNFDQFYLSMVKRLESQQVPLANVEVAL
ncbi:MAG: ChaN family lipoprotein [Pseudobdellovibrionaceae bacterium]|nr:ChaN family lipoprotein [Bdellovibrionales bacterium]USN48231.1 MAG: ChaN family lipoprotein [Pseudobdellovibrionaceae bacterium]